MFLTDYSFEELLCTSCIVTDKGQTLFSLIVHIPHMGGMLLLMKWKKL
jgi:hypothetical protein